MAVQRLVSCFSHFHSVLWKHSYIILTWLIYTLNDHSPLGFEHRTCYFVVLYFPLDKCIRYTKLWATSPGPRTTKPENTLFRFFKYQPPFLPPDCSIQTINPQFLGSGWRTVSHLLSLSPWSTILLGRGKLEFRTSLGAKSKSKSLVLLGFEWYSEFFLNVTK